MPKYAPAAARTTPTSSNGAWKPASPGPFTILPTTARAGMAARAEAIHFAAWRIPAAADCASSTTLSAAGVTDVAGSGIGRKVHSDRVRWRAVHLQES